MATLSPFPTSEQSLGDVGEGRKNWELWIYGESPKKDQSLMR